MPLVTSGLKPRKFGEKKTQNKQTNKNLRKPRVGRKARAGGKGRESLTAQVHREDGEPALLAASLFPGASSTQS